MTYIAPGGGAGRPPPGPAARPREIKFPISDYLVVPSKHRSQHHGFTRHKLLLPRKDACIYLVRPLGGLEDANQLQGRPPFVTSA